MIVTLNREKLCARRREKALTQEKLPRPSPGWLFLSLILAALWALWYSWGALWSALLT